MCYMQESLVRRVWRLWCIMRNLGAKNDFEYARLGVYGASCMACLVSRKRQLRCVTRNSFEYVAWASFVHCV